MDLSQLIDYHLYGLDCGYVDVDDEELCETLEIDRRVDDAVLTVERWCDDDGALHDVNEWIAGTLVEIVSGRSSPEDVPWTR